MALNIPTKIENSLDNYSLDAYQVKGGYGVVEKFSDLASLPAATIVNGSLYYAIQEQTFYAYNGTTWEQKLYTVSQVEPALVNKADKDLDATEGNIAVFDNNGNPVDGLIPSAKLIIGEDEAEIPGEVVINADLLEGHPASYFAKAGEAGVVDTNLDPTSQNPVTNAVLTDAIGYKASYEYVNQALQNKVSTEDVGVAGGVASLDSTGKVPASQVPITVEANPTITGSEADLSSIKINSVNYKVAMSDSALTSAKATGGIGWTDSTQHKISNSYLNTVDNVTSTDTQAPLSANQGKILNDKLNGLGRYLTTWDCSSGKPTTDPTSLPYTYKAGDYYKVGNIAIPLPSGQYAHVIECATSDTSYTANVKFIIYTISSTQMSLGEVVQWLYNNGYRSVSWLYKPATGTKVTGVTVEQFTGVCGDGENTEIIGVLNDQSSNSVRFGLDGTFSDTVITTSTNYKPTGSTYTGASSTVAEINDVAIGDVYFYDGTNWTLLINHLADTYTKAQVDALVNAKSAVSVSSTGTSTEEVQYITIDGLEKKLAGGGSSQFVVTLTEDNNYAWTADKTYEQLVAALSETQNIVALAKHSNIIDNVLLLVTCKEDQVVGDTYKFVFKATTKDGDPIVTAECSETGWEVWRGKWKPYLTFESDNLFTMLINPTQTSGEEVYLLPWDGTMEYSLDKTTWTTLTLEMLKTGTGITTSSNNTIYLRGLNNTYISDPNDYKTWYIGAINFSNDAKVRCKGNIENLLDWKQVLSGNHPVMANGCFKVLFKAHTIFTNLWNGTLIEAPELPATTLTESCYYLMFYKNGIEVMPDLPAKVLPASAYEEMFSNCENLKTPGILSATTAGYKSCNKMFYSCSKLLAAPNINLTTVADSCCKEMFYDCREMATPPEELPATTLVQDCYYSMFAYCYKLLRTPVLRATTLAPYCYCGMFSECKSLTSTAEMYHSLSLEPEGCCQVMYYACSSLVSVLNDISSSTSIIGQEACAGMFASCTNLKTPPAINGTTIQERGCAYMFEFCSQLTRFPELAPTNIGEGAYERMFNGCYSLKVYNESGSEHAHAIRIPYSGTPTGTLTHSTMFTGCLGDYASSSSYTIPDSGATLYTLAPVVR